MDEPHVLAQKVVALRRQLEQVRGLAHAAGNAAESLLHADTDECGRRWRFGQRVEEGARHSHLLDATLRPLGDSETTPLPQQLTGRARRLLEKGQRLVRWLRDLDAEPLLHADEAAPLARLYRDTAAMAYTTLRMTQALPDAAAGQLRLCPGLEAILDAVAERVAQLTEALGRRRRENELLDTLAGLLIDLNAGRLADVQPFADMAADVRAEVEADEPLRFLAADPGVDGVAWFIAAHSLTTARVLARLTRHDADVADAVLAALLHDAGMLAVPAEVLTQRGPFTDEQRRLVERHARVGGELSARVLPNAAWLAEAATAHHERPDGTGYPDGRRAMQLAPLTRLLAVCATYAALATPRPHRAALDPRTALTDTLLLAEKGRLDKACAERLLHLSFYPAGTAVELSDGAIGVVVATPASRRDVHSPARPVVMVLTDGDGRFLPTARHVDLASCEHRRVVRTLSEAERRTLLGPRYPEWA